MVFVHLLVLVGCFSLTPSSLSVGKDISGVGGYRKDMRVPEALCERVRLV